VLVKDEVSAISDAGDNKRTHIVMSNDLVAMIDSVVGKRGRSAFLTRAAEKELMRLRQLKALDAAAGSWKDENHPELRDGSGDWARSLRREFDQRPEKHPSE
jgi:hypothetical protein